MIKNNPFILSITWVVFTLFASCIEQFSFNSDSEQDVLVVDGFVSNVSFNDIADKRYFDIRLLTTGKVINSRDEPVINADIQISNDLSEYWDYTEVEPGLYRLYYDDFKAESGRTYQLHIELANGETYESDPGELPVDHIESELIWEETTWPEYRIVAGEPKIREARGLLFKADMPEFESNSLVYNRWDFLTTYTFTALRAPEDDPNRVCWIHDQFFVNEVVINRESKGGTVHNLFYFNIDTRLVKGGISILARQQSMTEVNYQFWLDLKNQENQADLFAPPPYNLVSNLKPVGHDGDVLGYFGVVRESFNRWVFDPSELSYFGLKPGVSTDPECRFPSPECLNCWEGPFPPKSVVTNIQPVWWLGW
ncbi:MAG: DUF4249 domain-containing protein [Reichenbachiella sp.]|uniref:DUF4249 domain-containing protein n=1 Tax=Reichenbachiella sp. TaxID=2184521 RepID=UPI0032670909